jgi:hypothetical protein
MATARVTLGSLLGTVNTAASTLTGTIGTIGKTVGMLDVLVTSASIKQRMDTRADLADYAQKLRVRCAQEEAEMHLDVVEFCGRSAAHKKLYADAFNKYSKLIPDYTEEMRALESNAG